jgi:hypothetical protein
MKNPLLVEMERLGAAIAELSAAIPGGNPEDREKFVSARNQAARDLAMYGRFLSTSNVRL